MVGGCGVGGSWGSTFPVPLVAALRGSYRRFAIASRLCDSRTGSIVDNPEPGTRGPREA